MPIHPVFSWYTTNTSLLLYATVTVRMRCIGRGVAVHCNVAKVRRGTNAVRLKSQGRRNVTAQQLLSLFSRSTVQQNTTALVPPPYNKHCSLYCKSWKNTFSAHCCTTTLEAISRGHANSNYYKCNVNLNLQETSHKQVLS